MIDYYTAKSLGGNTRKISIMLAETQLDHVVHFVDLARNAQQEPWYLAINPYGKIPAIVDHAAGGHSLAESGAILIYLAEKTGKFLPKSEPARSKAIQWVFWQVGSIGPTFGQLNHFATKATERVPSVIERFSQEAQRLLSELNAQLANNEFVVGEYSIADMALLSWIKAGHEAFIRYDTSLTEKWKHISRWVATVSARPAVHLAMTQYAGSAVRVGRDADVYE